MNSRDAHVDDALEQVRAALADDPEAAARKAREISKACPDNSQAHRLLGAALRRLGRHQEAGQADMAAVQASARSPQLLEAARAMQQRQVGEAERLLRSYLDANPDDPQALRMLAEIAAVCGHGGDAERLLRKALEAAPGFVPLYVNLAALLHDLRRTDEAITLLDQVLAENSANSMVLSFKAEILGDAGRMNEALETHEALLALAPDAAVAWMNYGYALKTVGRTEDAIAAYRKSLRLDPKSGPAWWGFANLRTVKLDQQDIPVMQQALAEAGDDLNRLQLHFALGKALGDQGCFEESFSHYATANEIRRTVIPYAPRPIEEVVRKAQTLFTRAFLDQRAGYGCPATDPVFIVGLPRSGSTLVEQILASHSQIEGAGELFDIEKIAMGMAARENAESWLDAIGSMSADALRALGENYLASTRIHRKMARPFFTDKLPFNWLYTGFIHLVFPNARIIDVRRHPLGCCFSNFSLYFSRLTSFPSSLEELGHYYRAYVQMMAHFDRVRPGRIHRVRYEDLVEDFEDQVRRLLGHLDLPFEEACLRFHENPRPVHTPSAQQVRRPINREGLEHWKNYEPWLGPLKEALGPALDPYPTFRDK